MSNNILKLYFSLRSPYSWLGYHRFASVISGLQIDYELIPLSPTRKLAARTMPTSHKLEYVKQDIRRIASAYGLEYKRPEPFDGDWFVPHAAFIQAKQYGEGMEFINQMYQLRFGQGRDISEETGIRMASEACGLDADEIYQAAKDKQLRRQLLQILSSAQEQGVFGVPTLQYKDQLFWGNDRLEWCIREIYQDQGRNVPDLSTDLVARPF